MKRIDEVIKYFKEASISTNENKDNAVFNKILDAANTNKPSAGKLNSWRIIMHRKITKFAAAAIVIVGISAVFLFNSSPDSIALADVYAKVQQAQAFMYKMSMSTTGMGEMTRQSPMNISMMESTVTASNEYGLKMESTVHMTDPNLTMHHQVYISPNEKTMMVILPDSKMYQPMEVTDNVGESFEMMGNSNWLREMVKGLMTQQYTELGCSEIDGITVQGFQFDDEVSESTTTLWVDVDTHLLVKFEVDTIVGERESHIVMDQFRWDISVDANDFEYVIPDDYREIGSSMEQGSMKMPELLEMNDQAAIKGLEAYKEFFDRYPENIDLMSLMTSLKNMSNPETELGEKFLEKIKRKMETVGLDPIKIQESLMREFFTPMQSLGMFHMQLLQDKKDPAYYGVQVTPEDTDAVLMRWKLDNGKYKVIFGDLSSVEMQYEDLIKIEPQPEPAQTEPARQ